MRNLASLIALKGIKVDAGVESVNICVVPTAQRVFCNNLMAGFYKLAQPDTYIHGGFDHIYYPITESMPQGMDLVTQYKELMEIGFDDSILTGLKLSESACDNILYNNYVNRVSKKPREINKVALKAYYDKYKHLIPKKDLLHLEPLYKKYL